MTERVGYFADWALSLFVPRMTAAAAPQTKCVRCGSSTRSKLCRRDCVQGKCEPWWCASCGTC